MFKELSTDVGKPTPPNGDLTAWAKQGVLLLNTVLTVRQGQPTSHQGQGWEQFTDRVISELNNKTTPVVFLLWGAHAQRKAQLITNPIHYKLATVHPSPLSAHRGYFGCRHFSKANAILEAAGEGTIDWNALLAAFESIGYQGVFNYEVSNTPAEIKANYEQLFAAYHS